MKELVLSEKVEREKNTELIMVLKERMDGVKELIREISEKIVMDRESTIISEVKNIKETIIAMKETTTKDLTIIIEKRNKESSTEIRETLEKEIKYVRESL